MSFRKLCHMPFRKLIPPFTLTEAGALPGRGGGTPLYVVYEGTTGEYECIYRFNSKCGVKNRNMRIRLKNFFVCVLI